VEYQRFTNYCNYKNNLRIGGIMEKPKKNISCYFPIFTSSDDDDSCKCECECKSETGGGSGGG